MYRSKKLARLQQIGRIHRFAVANCSANVAIMLHESTTSVGLRQRQYNSTVKHHQQQLIFIRILQQNFHASLMFFTDKIDSVRACVHLHNAAVKEGSQVK